MFRNVKTLSKKLILSFVIVTIISTISSVLGLFLVNQTDSDYSAALEQYGNLQGYVGQMGTQINAGGSYIRDIVFLESNKELSEAKGKLDATAAEVNRLMDIIEELCPTDESRQLYQNLTASLAAYRAGREKVVTYGMANQQEAGLTEWKNVAEPLLIDVENKAQEFMDYCVSAGGVKSTELTSNTRFMSNIMTIVCVIGFAVSIAMALLIARGISRPVKACADRIVKLAEGDLKSAVPTVDTKDETFTLAASTQTLVSTLNKIISDEDYLLHEMAEGNFDITSTSSESYVGDFHSLLESVRAINSRLSSTLSQINQASDQVASGSDQVSGGAQALSQGATEQASAVEELSASITEISEQVRRNAENASNAKRISLSAAQEVEQGNSQMQQMIAAMGEISDKSNEIGKIIKTIDDIAFQTNILALNAAVEAARAGAAGKGFAVVADEVRNLAGKSAEAAKSTTALIEDSINAVQNGTHIADETAKSLNAIVESTAKSTELIEAIASASSDQATSIAQVTQGVEQISNVVQTNSATAEESAAASEELSGQAQMLKELIGQFKLKASDTNAYTSSPAAKNDEKSDKIIKAVSMASSSADKY